MSMKFLPVLAALIALALTGCGENKNAPGAGTNTASSESSPLTAPVDYLGAVVKAKQTAEKTVDTASLNQAIQMFRVEQGRNPKDLNELVTEKTIPRIPDAPYGMKLVYDAASGTVKVVPDPAAKK
jgi:curli biogenesis system outer membrane secretion channel CsgG